MPARSLEVTHVWHQCGQLLLEDVSPAAWPHHGYLIAFRAPETHKAVTECPWCSRSLFDALIQGEIAPNPPRQINHSTSIP